MAEEYDIKKMCAKVKTLRKAATELKAMSGGIQAVDRNVDRMMANIRALEINLVEVDRIMDNKKLN